MKKAFKKASLWVLAFGFLAGFISDYRYTAFAEDAESAEVVDAEAVDLSGTRISISPVSETFQLYSNSVYDKTFTVTNDGNENMEVEIYTSPYAYSYSEEQEDYQLGFNTENSFTQITRWISFRDLGGSYVENPHYNIAPGETIEIAYRITTPSSIPAGGQYAVIFAHTLSGNSVGDNGVVTEAAPGIIIYGRSMEGDTIESTEIFDLKIEKTTVENTDEEGGGTKAGYFASAKIKNTGNIDVTASGTLTVSSLFGKKIYETEILGDNTVSVIPESEREVFDTWSDMPDFGVYVMKWSVAAGDNTEDISRLIFINFTPVVVVLILLLTGAIFWIIIVIRKRKERRSRLAI